MEEQAFMVCMRADELVDPVEGSTRTACVECGCDLWISLESRRLCAEKKAMPICGPCGLRMAKEQPTMVTEIGDPTVGQLGEIEQAIKAAASGGDPDIDALVAMVPSGAEDMDSFELLKVTAKLGENAMVNPQDDWGSMIIIEGYDGRSFPPIPLGKMLEAGIPKHVIAHQILPGLAHASHAKRVMFALSSWTLKIEKGAPLPKQLDGPISEHPDRLEALVLIDVTADGVVGMSTALITRDGVSGPKLGEWEDSEHPEQSDGLFVEAIVPVLSMIKTLRESSGV
jgi:hypothetical protein